MNTNSQSLGIKRTDTIQISRMPNGFGAQQNETQDSAPDNKSPIFALQYFLHLLDLGTNLIFIKTILKYWVQEELFGSKNIGFIVLALFILERGFQFYYAVIAVKKAKLIKYDQYIIQQMQQSEKPEEQEKDKNKKKIVKDLISDDIFWILFLILTFSELFINNTYSNLPKMENNFMNTKVVHLCFVNFPMFMMQLTAIIYSNVLEIDVEMMLTLGFLTSYIQSLVTLYNLYLYKQLQQQMLKEKQDVIFNTLSVKCRLWICTPYQPGIIKGCSDYLQEFPELFKNENAKNILDFYREHDEETGQKLIYNISTRSKIWIFIYLSINLIVGSSLWVLSSFTILAFNDITPFIIAFALSFPHFIIHLGLSLRYGRNFLLKIVHFFKCILGIPIHCLTAALNLLLPLKTERLPLVQNIKETWQENFISTAFISSLKMVLIIIQYYATTQLKSGNLASSTTTEDMIDQLQNNKTINIFYLINILGLIFTIITNLIYFFEYLYVTYVRPPTPEEIKQWETQKDKEQEQILFSQNNFCESQHQENPVHVEDVKNIKFSNKAKQYQQDDENNDQQTDDFSKSQFQSPKPLKTQENSNTNYANTLYTEDKILQSPHGQNSPLQLIQNKLNKQDKIYDDTIQNSPTKLLKESMNLQEDEIEDPQIQQNPQKILTKSNKDQFKL